jgi:hypothetical protein
LEFALLTNISYQWSGKTAQEYKYYKGLLKNDNLRDHMTKTEMLLTDLSEVAGKEIAKSRDAQGFNEVQEALLTGSTIAKKTREALEFETGTSVLDTNNRLTARQQSLRQEAQQKQPLKHRKK